MPRRQRNEENAARKSLQEMRIKRSHSPGGSCRCRNVKFSPEQYDRRRRAQRRTSTVSTERVARTSRPDAVAIISAITEEARAFTMVKQPTPLLAVAWFLPLL